MDLKKMDQQLKASLPKIQVNIASEYYEEIIEGLYTLLLSNRDEYLKKFLDETTTPNSEPLSPEEDNYIDDKVFFYDEATNLAGEMVIIALYKTIEIAIKNMLKFSKLFTNEEIKDCFRIDVLKRIVNKKICDIEQLNGFKSYDELRLINNCIKHRGIVSTHLAGYPNWKEGEEITDPFKEYGRLKNGVHSFLQNFKNEIIGVMAT